jgi:NAD(P)-dependent dehydrogenase (short-subunit alcohol dehydrogenase family)
MRFDGKAALITGGTSGIGEATVRRVAHLGAKTLFVGRNEESGRWIERELVRDGAEAIFFKADLGRPEEVRRIVPAVVNIFGRLDFAFNNAGISGENGFIADQKEANFDDVFAVNVKGLYIALQNEIQQLVRQGWGGSIVNMASVSGLVATPGASVYIASKHAVIGLTKSAAIEYGPQGIRVNAISPGAIRTEMLNDIFGAAGVNQMVEVHPLRRIGSSDDVADAVVWMFSDHSSYYTGQSLVLDGGLTAQRPFLRPAITSSQFAGATADRRVTGPVESSQVNRGEVISIEKPGDPADPSGDQPWTAGRPQIRRAS